MTRLTTAMVLVIGLCAGALAATAIPTILGRTVTPADPAAPAALMAGVEAPAAAVASAPAPIAAAPAAAELVTSSAAPAVVRAAYREVTIPAGTALRLRLENGIATDTARVEDALQAELLAPIVVGGRTVVPAGSTARGHVTSVRRSAKVKGRAYLAFRFTELQPVGDDERYDIRTRVWAREAQGTKRKDAMKIGVPAGVGAVVGGIVGGKKGAGVGAAVGGGAGTGVVLATRGDEVRLPRGSTVIVRLAEPVRVRVS